MHLLSKDKPRLLTFLTVPSTTGTSTLAHLQLLTKTTTVKILLRGGSDRGVSIAKMRKTEESNHTDWAWQEEACSAAVSSCKISLCSSTVSDTRIMPIGEVGVKVVAGPGRKI